MGLIETILSNCNICGIASDEVKFAKELLAGKGAAVKSDKESFVCEGLWAAEELMERKLQVTHFFISSDALQAGKLSDAELETVNKISKYADNSYAISDKACKKISDRDGADFCFIIARPEVYTLDTMPLKDNMLIMILDGQEQPGNIGAILRSLDCAGGSGAIVVNRRVKLSNSRLVRSALGASFTMPVVEADMEEAGKWLTANNFKAVLTDLTATKAYCDVDYSGRIAIVAGNEHTGISAYWRTLPIAEPVIIPMLGSCESLNVGFASTLVAYEAGLKMHGIKK